jgi:endoglucanase
MSRLMQRTQQNPKALFRMDEGQNSGSGPYDKYSDREERFWALAELLKTTGELKYDAAIQKNYEDLQSSQPVFLSWGNGKLFGQWAVATAVTQPSAGKAAAIQAIIQGADEITEQVEMDGYRSALSIKEYTWASNKNALAKGEFLLLANELKANDDYIHGAADQVHYVLGRNAMGISYVTGAGERHTLHPHHRISASTGVLVPGLLVGGPNRYGDDPVLKTVVDQGVAPAKSYIDSLDSYASNEYAIDYNAPLFFSLALLR